MSLTTGSPVRSTIVNRVSEMTLVTEICQGFTPRLTIGRSGGKIVFGRDTTSPPVRYVDNLREALGFVAAIAAAGPTLLNHIATIHFARWVVLPGDTQLLFTSNFDGSWEQYIHDFATVSLGGSETSPSAGGGSWLDLIWGNCVGYPGTSDIDAFLCWIGDNMVPTTLFFPTISTVTVRDTAWLCQFRELFGTFDEAALAVDRTTWPVDLLAAYDTFKSAVNRIDVTVV
jgi:hypothetical protein